jgi:hypothetical protein
VQRVIPRNGENRRLANSPRRKRRSSGPEKSGDARTQVLVRLSEPMFELLTRWCSAQIERPTRAEAMRRMMVRCLREDGLS